MIHVEKPSDVARRPNRVPCRPLPSMMRAIPAKRGQVEPSAEDFGALERLGSFTAQALFDTADSEPRGVAIIFLRARI